LAIRKDSHNVNRGNPLGGALLLAAQIIVISACYGLVMPAVPEARFERLGPHGGTVRSLLISPANGKIVYLGTSDGQLFKSFDGGVSWGLLYPGIAQRQVVIDTIVEYPRNENHIYAGGWDLRSDGGGLFESKDGGRSWQQVPLPKASVAVRGFAICHGEPANMIAGTLAGVFLTSDGGLTWRQVGAEIEAFRQVESVAIDPVDPRRLLIGTWHLGYRSNDSGATWTQNDRGMIPDSDVFSIAIDPRDTKNVFASACTGLYRSIDRGTSWRRLKVFPNSFLVRALTVYIDPGNSELVYGGTTEGLFVSRNSGQNWNRITRTDLTVNTIQVDPANNKVILLGTEFYGIMRSEDGGVSWTESNTGFVNRSIARIVPDYSTPGRFLVGENSEGRTGGFHVYDAARGEWASIGEREVPGEGMLSLLVLPGERGRIVGTAHGAYLQSAGSGAWTRLPGPIGTLAVYDLAADREGTWIFAGTNDGVYRAAPADLSFAKPPGYRLIPRVFSLLTAQDGSGRIFAGTHMGVLCSDDSGATWRIQSDGIPDHTLVHCLISSPAAANHFFAGTSAGLYESKDGGNSWKAMRDGRLGRDISSVIFLGGNGAHIMAADNTSGGVFWSEDSGLTWARIESSEFSSPVRCLAQDLLQPATVYLGTGTEGIYRLRLPVREPLPATSKLTSGSGIRQAHAWR
jgi:photosystem II stability/assembly factor-like uncharacterized protein